MQRLLDVAPRTLSVSLFLISLFQLLSVYRPSELEDHLSPISGGMHIVGRLVACYAYFPVEILTTIIASLPRCASRRLLYDTGFSC